MAEPGVQSIFDMLSFYPSAGKGYKPGPSEPGREPGAMVQLPIYMDAHATTAVDRRVLDAMLPYFTERFGNAASRNHVFGWEAAKTIEKAREQIARLIGASAKEIVFTSGATESNNLAIKGVAEIYRDRGDHLITVATEHRAVLDPFRRLERQGYRVTSLPVQPDGLIDLDDLRQAISDKTILISVMAANNEIGVLQPLAEVGQIAREHEIFFHTDAAQACGKVPIDVNALHADLVSMSGHKMYGPKGIGALYVRRRRPRVHLAPLVEGGGHERGLRSGTLNVPGVVGFGKAAEICQHEMPSESKHLQQLRDRLNNGLQEKLHDVYVNGSMEARLPHNLNVSFASLDGDSLLLGITQVAVSSGSACTSASVEPSHVLKALGVDDDLAHASIRFGLGRFNTEEEVDYVADYVAHLVTHLRRPTVMMR